MAIKKRKRTHQFPIKELPHWIWKTRYSVKAIMCNKVLDSRVTVGEVGALIEKKMMKRRYRMSKIEITKYKVKVMEMRKYEPKDF